MEFFAQKLFLKGRWNCNWKLKPSVDSCLMSCNIFISANCLMPFFQSPAKLKWGQNSPTVLLFFSETYSWKLRSSVESNDWYLNSKYSEWKKLRWFNRRLRQLRHAARASGTKNQSHNYFSKWCSISRMFSIFGQLLCF